MRQPWLFWKRLPISGGVRQGILVTALLELSGLSSFPALAKDHVGEMVDLLHARSVQVRMSVLHCYMFQGSRPCVSVCVLGEPGKRCPVLPRCRMILWRQGLGGAFEPWALDFGHCSSKRTSVLSSSSWMP